MRSPEVIAATMGGLFGVVPEQTTPR